MSSPATTRRTKGAGAVFQDGKGGWHFRTERGYDPVTGKRLPPIETTGRIKSDTRDRHKAKILEYQRTGVLRSQKGPRVADYAERWMADRVTRVKPNSWNNEYSWMRVMCRHIGGVRLADLTAEHLRRMTSDLLTTRKVKTVSDYLRLLSSMLENAIDDGIIAANPCRRVKLPRKAEYEPLVLDREQPRAMIGATSTDDARIRGDADDDAEMWSIMFELAFASGLREGERYAIMPFQLERRDNHPGIRVCQQLQEYKGGPNATIPAWLNARHLSGNIWLTTLKTNAGTRFVPISENLWNRIWTRIRNHHIADHELVFTNNQGRPIRRTVEIRRWKKALETAGLPYTRINDARHWTATQIAMSGAAPDERMALIGHADMTTNAHYTHWNTQALADAMNRAIPPLASDDVIEAEVLDAEEG